ncbi:hypothetical protein EV127DRAFT_181398 [Xylaria flabelliformis]|nr:hypothetical protein EV127DRAFT_181398 [Xylaria flabelliformis]
MYPSLLLAFAGLLRFSGISRIQPLMTKLIATTFNGAVVYFHLSGLRSTAVRDYLMVKLCMKDLRCLSVRSMPLIGNVVPQRRVKFLVLQINLLELLAFGIRTGGKWASS